MLADRPSIAGLQVMRLGELLLETGFQIVSRNVEDKFCICLFA